MCQCFLLRTWLLPASCPLSCAGMCVLFPVLTWIFPAVYIDLDLFSVECIGSTFFFFLNPDCRGSGRKMPAPPQRHRYPWGERLRRREAGTVVRCSSAHHGLDPMCAIVPAPGSGSPTAHAASACRRYPGARTCARGSPLPLAPNLQSPKRQSHPTASPAPKL